MKSPRRADTIVFLAPSQIDPAPWQPRGARKADPLLVRSITGGGHGGVGVLEPVLVRRVGRGRYQLIDGERRWRACLAIQMRSPESRIRIPARVLAVSESVAQLIGVTVDASRVRRTYYEAALGLQRLREALRAEHGDAAATVRAIARVCPLEKTQVGRYLAVADAMTPEVLRLAGLLDADETPDLGRLALLTTTDLWKAAQLRDDGPTACAAELTRRVNARESGSMPRRTEHASTTTADAHGSGPIPSLAERWSRLTREGGLSLKVPRPIEVVAPDQARELVEQDVAPALLALVERAFGGTGREGAYASVAAEHAVVVVPSGIETLSLSQLTQLSACLGQLHRRTQIAIRHRRRVSATPMRG